MPSDPKLNSLTEPGWPRPVVGGYPIPWISPSSDLSETNGDRHEEVLADLLCQVCGCAHDPESLVYVLVNDGDTDPGQDVSDKWAQPIDDGVLHERCLRLAAGRCPSLKGLRVQGRLVILRCPIEAVSRGHDDERKEDRLMADGAQCEVLDTELFLASRQT